MRVLNSSEAFLKHYAASGVSPCRLMGAAGGGVVTGGGFIAGAGWLAGTAAANASAWSALASWPLIGSFAAGKAAAIGITAGVAAASSAAVLVPAAVIGGGVAYAVYRMRGKRSLQKGSRVEELANAFAHVAFLPTMALAVTVCKANPANTMSVRDYILKKAATWGYAESYIRANFDETLERFSAKDLNGQYKWAMAQLESGSAQGIGATVAELPPKAIKRFADAFKNDFESCIG